MSSFVQKYLADFRTSSLKILDVGSQDVNGSYRPLFSNPNWHYQGLDIAPGKNVDIVVGNAYHWKQIRSGTYDVVVSGQAFEHIEYFWVTINEMTRVLKPGGLCCVIAPSSGPEHRYPVDCWRFFPDGLAAAAKYATLEVAEVYTCQEPVIDDEENTWKDTVLVSRKPVAGVMFRAAASSRTAVMHLISRRPVWFRDRQRARQ